MLNKKALYDFAECFTPIDIFCMLRAFGNPFIVAKTIT